jgi:hypothetical protein
LVALVLGVIALCPVASCSGVASLWFRHSANAAAPLRAPGALLRDPPDEDDAITVRVTPQPGRAVGVKDRDRGRSLLVPIEEERRFALLVPAESHLVRGTTMTATATAMPPAMTATLIVHRDQGYLGDGVYWGVDAKQIEVYVLEDPRVGAAHEAHVSGVTSIAGFCVALLMLPLGTIISRRAKTRPANEHDA